MAHYSLCEALDVLNTARTFFSREILSIEICDEGKEVQFWFSEPEPKGALGDYLDTVYAAGKVVTGVIGEGSEYTLAEDHRGRWVLVRFA